MGSSCQPEELAARHNGPMLAQPPTPFSPGSPGPDGVSGGTVTPGPVGLYLSARMVFLDYWGPYEGVALHAQSNARVPQILATCRLNAARLVHGGRR